MVRARPWHAISGLLVRSPEVLPLRCANLAVAGSGAQRFVLIGVVLTRSRVRILLLWVLLAHASHSFHTLTERVNRFHIVTGTRHILPRLLVPEVGPARGSNLAVVAAALLAVRLTILVLAGTRGVVFHRFVL